MKSRSAMLTAKQVAELLGLSISKVYDLARSSKLANYRFDGALRFDETDVEAFKLACRIPMRPSPMLRPPVLTVTLKASSPTGESDLGKYFRLAHEKRAKRRSR